MQLGQTLIFQPVGMSRCRLWVPWSPKEPCRTHSLLFRYFFSWNCVFNLPAGVTCHPWRRPAQRPSAQLGTAVLSPAQWDISSQSGGNSASLCHLLLPRGIGTPLRLLPRGNLWCSEHLHGSNTQPKREADISFPLPLLLHARRGN